MPSKNSQFHFYADECIPIPSVIFLRERGISITHAADIEMVGKSDPYQLKISKKLGRVFLTLDHDFKQVEDVSLNGHPGIILIKVTSPTPKNINQVLSKLLKNISEDFMRNSKVTVTMDKITRERNGEVVTKRI